MLDPKNVSFDKLNKPSFTADAKCTIVETTIKELLARGGTLTEEQRIAVLTLGTHIVQKTVDTINHVLEGEATLVTESGDFDTLTFFMRPPDNSILIGRRVSTPNEQGLRITGSYLTIG
jgi:hypothetical protein